MGTPLPKPVLSVSKNLVAEALEHMQALKRIHAQMEAAELARVRAQPKLIVKLRPSNPGSHQERMREKLKDFLR